MRRTSLRKSAELGVVVALLVGANTYVQAQGIAGVRNREPDVIFAPTPNDVVDMMLHLARLGRSDTVYDLGCGDGRIVVAAAKKYGCKAVGYDIDPIRVRESLENSKKNKVEHLVRIEQKDVFALDLSDASVVTLYLLPELNVRLIPQLEKLKSGSRIVSHEFDMQGIKPDMVLDMWSKEDERDHRVYVWTTPLKKQEAHIRWVEVLGEDEVEVQEEAPAELGAEALLGP